MEALFLKCLNMGIAAGWVILVVLLLRLLFRKVPKSISCALWILVGIRLICPFSIESVLSLLPSAQTVPPEIMTAGEPAIESGIRIVDNVVNPAIASSFAPNPQASVNPMQIVIFLGSRLWRAGVGALFLYALISSVRLRRKVAIALRLEGNLWICDAVKSPFIFGIFAPRIYLPSDLEEPKRSCVIAHERAHLKRHDHWWKPLAFTLLSVYWFQPLCWVAYLLFCRDIEFACDEYVVKQIGEAQKKNYADTLLFCATSAQGTFGCPLAFGEVGVRERIKSVLYYRKPAFWVVAAVAVVSVAAAVCLLTDPMVSASKNGDEIYGARYTVSKVLYDAPWYNATYTAENAPEYIITPEAELLQKSSGGIMGDNPVWNSVGVFHQVDGTDGIVRGMPGLNEDAGRLLDIVARVWRVDCGGSHGSSYYVMETDRGEVLFAMAAGEEGQEEIRWLWKMERHRDRGDTAYLAGLISAMSSQRNVQIFALYESDSIPDRLLAGFLGDKNKKYFAVFRRDSAADGGWRIWGYGPIKSTFGEIDQPSTGTSAFGYITIGEEWGFDHSITIAASSSLNLDSVTAQAGHESQSIGAASVSVPGMFVFEWSKLLEENDSVEVHFITSIP